MRHGCMAAGTRSVVVVVCGTTMMNSCWRFLMTGGGVGLWQAVTANNALAAIKE